jgi:hypothetical protein
VEYISSRYELVTLYNGYTNTTKDTMKTYKIEIIIHLDEGNPNWILESIENQLTIAEAIKEYTITEVAE